MLNQRNRRQFVQQADNAGVLTCRKLLEPSMFGIGNTQGNDGHQGAPFSHWAGARIRWFGNRSSDRTKS